MPKLIALSNGEMTLVDDEDYVDVLNRGYLHKTGKYASFSRITKNKIVIVKSLVLHLFIAERMGLVGEIDHKDRNELNNTRTNLRECTRSQNLCNREITYGNTKHKGIYWSEERQKYQVTISLENKIIHLGRFLILEEAIEARQKATEKYHGEFGRK